MTTARARRTCGAALTAALLAVGCAPHRTSGLPDPAGARRFVIRYVADSTFTFLIDGAKWVHPGAQGIAVDPRQRDLLVARFLVTRVSADTVLALITGQTTRVTDAHVALLEPPRRGPARSASFWAGFLGGAALGAAIASIVR